jgi:hypothetical protein
VPGPNRWANTYNMIYMRYLELDDPTIKIPGPPLAVCDTSNPHIQENRWREHIAWAVAHGIADNVLRMLKVSPSVVMPGAIEAIELRPWSTRARADSKFVTNS